MYIKLVTSLSLKEMGRKIGHLASDSDFEYDYENEYEWLYLNIFEIRLNVSRNHGLSKLQDNQNEREAVVGPTYISVDDRSIQMPDYIPRHVFNQLKMELVVCDGIYYIGQENPVILYTLNL